MPNTAREALAPSQAGPDPAPRAAAGVEPPPPRPRPDRSHGRFLRPDGPAVRRLYAALAAR